MLSSVDRQNALRIIDANANRAAEGLRVVEEYCRFVLADGHLTARCKALRHDLAQTLAAFPPEVLAGARDTLADVGTTAKTTQELTRVTLRDVAIASWQRVEQALRAIEEYGKLLDVAASQAVERLRYQTYTLAKACLIGEASRERLKEATLYVLIDGGPSRAAFAERATLLVKAGVHVLQLRDKQLDDRSLLERARTLRQIVAEFAATNAASVPLFIVNDRPDIALLAQADGVHVGQAELPVNAVRSLVGDEMLIGVSTHSVAQARQAVLDGADYLGCGPTFPSSTKQFSEFPGLDLLRSVAAEISLPAFAIGGISLTNLPDVLAAGFSRIAVSGALASSDEPTIEVGRLLRALGQVSRLP